MLAPLAQDGPVAAGFRASMFKRSRFLSSPSGMCYATVPIKLTQVKQAVLRLSTGNKKTPGMRSTHAGLDQGAACRDRLVRPQISAETLWRAGKKASEIFAPARNLVSGGSEIIFQKSVFFC